MAGELLVRVYNVGLGDCIYLRVPDAGKDVSILIDCGNKFGKLDLLGKCLKHLKEELPDADHGRKRLDLLVVSHPHEDHHKGFEEEFSSDIQIKHIWLSPAYKREYPQAEGFHALREAAARALNSLESFPGFALEEMSEDVRDLLSLSKSEALEMLNDKLPKINGIQPEFVTADTPKEKLKIFDDPTIKLKVIAPMSNIDGYYMGGEGLETIGSDLTHAAMVEGYQKTFPDPDSVEVQSPRNISAQDFKLLRSRIQANALAAAAVVGHVENNLSLVLLLEWNQRRLLFSGDAEWNEAHKGAVQVGRNNGSWNVMWQERKADLSQPLDFYKIGHHGSENATPWKPPDPVTGIEHPINAILNSLLPNPAAGEKPHACAVASTQRTKRWPSIPNAALMEEIGKRVANARTEYVEAEGPKAVLPHVLQPQRTDLEEQATATPVAFIDLVFLP